MVRIKAPAAARGVALEVTPRSLAYGPSIYAPLGSGSSPIAVSTTWTRGLATNVGKQDTFDTLQHRSTAQMIHSLKAVFMVIAWSVLAQATPAQGAASPDVFVVDDPIEGPELVLAEALSTRAARVRALTDGTLNPSINADGLFVVGLDGLGDVAAMQELVTAIHTARSLVEEAARAPEQADSSPAPRAKGKKLTGKPKPEPVVDGSREEPEPEPEPAVDGTREASAENESVASPDTVGVESSAEDTLSLEDARADLVAAYVAFFSLSIEEQDAALRTHHERAAALDEERTAEARWKAAREQAERDAASLESFLAGTLDPALDPTSLLQIDLLDTRELMRADHRRVAVLPDPSATSSVALAVSEAEQALRDAEQRLDRLRLQYLALSSEDKRALLAAHVASAEPPADPEADLPEAFVDEEAEQEAEDISEAEQEAEDAAREQAEALDVAREAQTEALRLVAEERARLLGVKQRQALFAAELPRWKQRARAHHEEALEWHRRIEAGESSDEPSVADASYEELRSELDRSRATLGDALARLSDPQANVPDPGDPLVLSADVDRGDLAELREELKATAEVLAREQSETGWEVAELLRDDAVRLNRDRLALLGRMSEAARDELTGLGIAGREQGRRELGQIGLELRYHAMSLPRDLASLRDAIERNPLDFVIGALQLVLLVTVFRAWRLRADDLLRGWSVGGRLTRTRGERLRNAVLWYARRIRKPLEWLVVLGLFPWLLGWAIEMPELRLPWLAAIWVLGGRTVVLVIDTIAARQAMYTFGRPGNAQLRFRSLRLIGLTVTTVGLILSLTADIVGKGTIYRWVIQGCWILAAPIGVWLVMQWRPIIFERLTALPRSNAFTRWATATQTGARGFLAATAGGAYLLLEGTRGWVMRQLSGLDTTRKVLAYLFRREVAKRAETTASGPRGVQISGVVFDQLGPQSQSTQAATLEGPARDFVTSAIEQTRRHASTLTAVVGERGAGKTTFLERVLAGSDETTCLVGCPPDGFDALLEVLAVQFDAPDYEPQSVIKAIRDAGSAVICIDDAHRMIAPAVGGLDQLDRFTRFALEVGGDVSWIVAVQRAAWHFVGRARGDRVFFDQVFMLPRWSEEQIASLIQSRCEAAGVEPNFEDLTVATAADEGAFEGRRTELGYYRILWDHSGGNPAVALHAWRHSLFTREGSEQPVVRLFVEPSSTEIERLSPTLLFVLRAIVQLEVATAPQVSECTQLPHADVADAIRYCMTHGYVELTGGRYRLSWVWYRTITTVLTRQHLLVA